MTKPTTPAPTARRADDFHVAEIREDFPILHQSIQGKPLVYLDNAATSQKPRQVLQAMTQFYSEDYSNIHRGVHTLSQRATDRYEEARKTVQRHLNAKDPREIVFTRGTTEGINLVANTFGVSRVKSGDEVLISTMEHHSNIVPWQLLCERTGAKLKVIPITDSGEILMEEFSKLLSPKTKLIALAHISNSLGTINPIREMIARAHERGIPVLVDGAQAVPHAEVDVQALDCDFYAFSGHKVYGPSGIGVLYGKLKHLESMPPYQGGGDMIKSVSFEKTTYNDLPHKFEAGTPHIAGAVGLKAALDYLNSVGLHNIQRHEKELLAYAVQEISKIRQVRRIGTAADQAGILSFVIEGVHAHDVGTVLDQEGVAIRAGHHCTQPLMDRLGVPATARASFGLYNTVEEIDALIRGIYKVVEVFG